MNKIIFSPDAWYDYVNYQTLDKQILKKINQLIKEILRNPESGLGKPERLKYIEGVVFSRKIDDKNRLVYRICDGQVEILQCRGHYDDH